MAGTVAHYQPIEQIGAGTLGVLYRARDLRYGRTVALRLVAPDLAAEGSTLAALFADAAQAARLSHPAIATLYGSGQEDGRAYLATEFVPGQRLSSMVGGTPINPRRALTLASQLADALALAHAHEIVDGRIA